MTIALLVKEKWLDSLNQCKSTRFCKVYGHARKLSPSEDGFYLEKYHQSFKQEERYHVRSYFHGQIESCANPFCEYKRFIGDTEPYKITKVVKGVEYEQWSRNVSVQDDAAVSGGGPDVRGNAAADPGQGELHA